MLTGSNESYSYSNPVLANYECEGQLSIFDLEDCMSFFSKKSEPKFEKMTEGTSVRIKDGTLTVLAYNNIVLLCKLDVIGNERNEMLTLKEVAELMKEYDGQEHRLYYEGPITE